MGMSGAASLVGSLVGGYRLARVIGMGATGAVYLGVRDDNPAERAAVKVLMPPLQLSEAERAEFHARFRREVQTLLGLEHPHILSVRAFGEDGGAGFPYMVLPYFDGGTLADRLAAGPLPLDEAAHYTSQIADALDYAHGRGVIHRDIKPSNVLLNGAGNAYLADFSIARLFEVSNATLT